MSKYNTEFYKNILGEWSDIVKHIINNNVEAIKPLINKTNVNTLFSLIGPLNTNGQKECVLNLASSIGRYEIVKYLLEVNANVNQQNTSGLSPIMCAIMIKYSNNVGNSIISNNDVGKVVKLLIEAKADFALQDEESNTLLHYISESRIKNIHKVAKLLMDKGLKDTPNNSGLTALHNSVVKNNIDVFKILIDHENSSDVNMKSLYGWSALYLAINNDNNLELRSEYVKYLISNKADVNIKHKDGPPLYLALEKNDFEVFKLLADTESCDLNIRNSEETPILLNCIKNEKLEFAQYLITKKADVNIELEFKLTPIYATIVLKNFEFFKFLIDNKANVNAKDKTGETILHFCIKESNVTEDYFENVKYICKNGGADLSIKDAKGNTPLKIALNKNNFKVALYFINLIKPLIEKLDIAAQAIKPIKQNHIDLIFTDKARPFNKLCQSYFSPF